jgi:hypothetical protein
MKRILFAIPMLALLCGCAGFTGDMLRQDVQIGVGVIRAVSCSVAVNGGFGSRIIQTADAIACQASGGTVVR